MAKVPEEKATGKEREPPHRGEVQYVLVGSLVGAILLLIALSVIARP